MSIRQRQTGFLTVLLLCVSIIAMSQSPIDRLRGLGSGFGGGGGGGGDSLKHRTGMEDSITINYRYLDSSRYRPLDSLINDFSKRFPIPSDYIYLGNTG